MKRRPEDIGQLPDGDPAPEATTHRDGAPPRPEREVALTLGEAVRTRALWLLMFASAFVAASQGSVNLHMMANFQERGLSDAVAVSMVSASAAAAVVSGLVWGLVMERAHVRWTSLMIMTFTATGTVVAIFANTLPLALLFALLYGIGLGGWVVASSVFWADYFGRRYLGAIRGFVSPVQLAANALGPLVAGLIFDMTGGYGPAFALFAVLFSLAMVQIALAAPPKKSPYPAITT